jgi:RNA polymerase sigma-70 factor (ECF subfamily)
MIAYDQDIVLLDQLQKGDQKAFEYLYTKYASWMMFVAVDLLQDEVEAQDIVQEFFIEFWEKKLYLKIDLSYKKNNASVFKSYFFIIIRNRCYNFLQRRKPRFAPLEGTSASAHLHTTDNHLENKELGAQLEEAIQQLPPQTMRVLRMNLEQKSRSEIADELGISVFTAKNLLAKARLFLRTQLKNVYSADSPATPKNVY